MNQATKNLLALTKSNWNVPIRYRGFTADQTLRKKKEYPIVNTGPNKHIPYKVYTIDDIPAPDGDWNEDYKKRNAKYNRELLFGFLFMLGPIIFHWYYRPIFWNAIWPPLPPKEERIKSFWDPPEYDED